MKAHKRIPHKRATPRRIHPERSGGHQRVRLHGKAREQRRAEIFARAGGRCEEVLTILRNVSWNKTAPYAVRLAVRCPNRATEWSHNRHAANKCDCMACGIASCHDCHVKRHNAGGKPCPKKVIA